MNTSAGVKHWHGAAPDSWFQHIAIDNCCYNRPFDDQGQIKVFPRRAAPY